MADNSNDQTTKIPPLENWAAQTFAYGFLLDRSLTIDYSGNAAPNQSGKGGFDRPQPDDIHLLNLNPQSFDQREPLATEIGFSVGGGKFIESRGGIIKHVAIRGTTGFLPPVAPYATHLAVASTNSFNANSDNVGTILRARSKQTGFYEFFHLRQLFRKFMLERRQGKNIAMHWLDFKSDEFWIIEPLQFNMSRSRFGYNYDISFDCLEPSQRRVSMRKQGMDRGISIPGRDVGADALRLLKNPLHASLDSVTARAINRITQLSSSAKGFVQRFSTGVLTLKLQSIISAATAIQSFFADVAAIRRTILDTPLSLYRQLYSALIGLEDAYTSVTPDAFKVDVNEWMIEMRFMTEGLISHHLDIYGSTPGQALIEENKKYTQPRATQGTKNNFFEEPTSSSSSPVVNPFIGTSGLDLVGSVEQMAATTALRAEDVLTGENIFDVAQRLLGDAKRFIELVVLNQLKAPFIVSDPNNKLSSTIAWGEKIYVPAVQDALSLSTASPITTPVQAFAGAVPIPLTDVSSVFGNADYLQNPWREDMWVGFTIEMTSGALLGQKRIIIANDESTVTVNRAFATPPALNDAFKIYLELFTSRRAPSPETVAFGRDMMAVFSTQRGVLTDGTVDLTLGPLKQTQTVEGLENLEQAIALCLQTTRGSNKSNPEYGTSSVIGRPAEPNSIAMHVFYVRQALMADPRISAVERPTLTYSGTSFFFSFYVRPVRVQRTLFFRIPI